MFIAFIIQNLSQKSDSVGYDCVYQYRMAKQHLKSDESVKIFAEVYDSTLHSDIGIEPFADFYRFIAQHPDALVIYHFCDGWEKVDLFLAERVKNLTVRWHNNTPPWFYIFDSVDFAHGCTRGFRTIAEFARTSAARFMVNSEFTRRQLQALDGRDSRISTVFPVSPFLRKPRSSLPPRAAPKATHAPIELLFVSRVVPHKGHRHVLSVASAVQRFLRKPVRVTFVGALEDRLKYYWEDLTRMARYLSVEATFTGLVSEIELTNHYTNADVFICLSEHEGFGMPVFEAMRFHVPVVAWASTAFSDLLLSHPLAPSVFDLAKFAACVVVALEESFRPRILAAQETILDSYTHDVVSGQLLHALQGVGQASQAGVAASVPSADLPNELSRRLSTLTDEIRGFAEKGQASSPHDSTVNYLSLYDIDVYEHLVDLARSDEASSRSELRELGDPEELHGSSAVVRAIMGNEARFKFEPLTDEELLKYDDWAFVRLAYLSVVQREPQRSELLSGLGHLRKGYGKVDLLRVLRSTGTPAETQAPPALASGREGPIEAGEKLSLIEDAVARLSRFLGATSGHAMSHPLGSVHHIDDLLRLNEAAFVKTCFRFVLGRDPDSEGLRRYRDALRGGLPRARMIQDLANSEEGKAHGFRLDGLADMQAGRSSTDQHLARRMNRLENNVGWLVNRLIVRSRGRDAASRDMHSAEKLARARKVSRDVERLALEPVSRRAPEKPTVLLDNRTAILDIHQILITLDGELPTKLPIIVQNNIESLKTYHPEARYTLWRERELRVFIGRHFDAEVLEAFDTLKPFALKADLARYCILYITGGLYSDLNNRFLGPFVVEGSKTVAFFREHRPQHGAVWMCQNTIIFAQAQQPEMKLAIDLVVANVRNREYGVSSLAPSGPVLFGRVFAALGRADKYQIGEAINIEVGGGLNRSCYVLSDGAIVAARMQGGGGNPSEMGLKGTNIYGKMWDRRVIYGENTFSFPHAHPSLKTVASRDHDGIFIPENAGGIQIFGPYVQLERGKYRATVNFTSTNSRGSLTLDVCGHRGEDIFAAERDRGLDESGKIDISFTLRQSYDDIEIRIWANAGFSGRFQGLTIVQEADARAELDAAPDEDSDVEERSNIRYIHHILDVNEQRGVPVLSKDLARNIAIARQMHPDAEAVLWTPNSLREFLASNFTEEIVDTYDRIVAFKMKSEFARYCLLYAIGGLYVDIGIRFVNPIIIPQKRVLGCFRHTRPEEGLAWAVDPALLVAEPSQPEFKELIDRIVANVRDGDYGVTSSSPSGADLLGRVLAMYFRAEQYHGGEIVALTRGYDKSNDCFVSLDGKLIALRMPLEEGEIDLDLRAQHEMESAWRERRLYTDKIKGIGEREGPYEQKTQKALVG